MNAPELEVVRFQSEDVIATSESAVVLTGPVSNGKYVTSVEIPGMNYHIYTVTAGTSGAYGDLLSVSMKDGTGSTLPFLTEGATYDVSTTYGGGVVITPCSGGHDHRLVYGEDGVTDIDKFLLGVAYVGDGK